VLDPTGTGPKMSAVKVTGDATVRYLNWTPSPVFSTGRWFYNYSYW